MHCWQGLGPPTVQRHNTLLIGFCTLLKPNIVVLYNCNPTEAVTNPSIAVHKILTLSEIQLTSIYHSDL